MGQKVNPQGFRLGVSQEPVSYWFAKNRHYSQLVVEDHFLRESIYKKFPNAGIDRIYIERQVDTIIIDVSSAQPRQLLGTFSKDQNFYTGIQDLRDQLKIELQQYRSTTLPFFYKQIIKEREFNSIQGDLNVHPLGVPWEPSKNLENGASKDEIDTKERKKQRADRPANFSSPQVPNNISIHLSKVSEPDTSAACLAEYIVEQLEKRIPFRRAMKEAVTRAQNANVDGIKVQISGRLNGAEIARSEWILKGRVPLHTLRAKVQYNARGARTIYGLLGVKVWVFIDD